MKGAIGCVFQKICFNICFAYYNDFIVYNYATVRKFNMFRNFYHIINVENNFNKYVELVIELML